MVRFSTINGVLAGRSSFTRDIYIYIFIKKNMNRRFPKKMLSPVHQKKMMIFFKQKLLNFLKFINFILQRKSPYVFLKSSFKKIESLKPYYNYTVYVYVYINGILPESGLNPFTGLSKSPPKRRHPLILKKLSPLNNYNYL